MASNMINVNELKPKDYSYIGSIVKTDEEEYRVIKDNKEYYNCVTFEQAYYLRDELNKCNWNKRKVPNILKKYKFYYTDLLEFYRYISTYRTKWCVCIPRNKSDNGITQQIRCTHLEDALYERDFLLENDWDYETLVYNIDDTKNPYYDVELPPYPQRKIKNVAMQDTHEKELLQINQLILEDSQKEEPILTQKMICKIIGISDMSLRNWLHNYGTNWTDYKNMVLDGDNPLDTLELKRHIYQPDLTRKKKKKEW